MPRHSIPDLAEAVHKYLIRVGSRSPGIGALIELLEVVHFTSLKNEEARPLQIRVVLVDPDDTDPERPPSPRPYRWKIVRLRARVPFTVASLAKLAKAADPVEFIFGRVLQPQRLFCLGIGRSNGPLQHKTRSRV